MNDCRPLPDLSSDHATRPRRHQMIYLTFGDLRPSASATNGAARWRGTLLPSDTAHVARDPDGASSESFLRLWPDDEMDRREPGRWPAFLSTRAIQGAVIANGAAIVALALLMAGPDHGSKAGLMTSATVLGFGLMFAAVAVVVSLNMRAPLRLARVAAPLSAAVSYGALLLAVVPLLAR